MEALLDDLLMSIAAFAILFDGFNQGRHLADVERHVRWLAEGELLNVAIESVHVPCVIEQFHGDDAVLDPIVSDALSIPVSFTLQDDVVEFGAIGSTVRKPDSVPVTVGLAFCFDLFDCIISSFVDCDPLQDGLNVFSVKTVKKFNVLVPCLNSTG